MKETGICPKCGSEEVYFEDASKHKNSKYRHYLIISKGTIFQKISYLEFYICIDCGYFEEYVSEKEIQNSEIREKIKTEWEKVPRQNK